MEEKIEDDLEPGLIVAEEPEEETEPKSRRGVITFLLYLSMFTLGLAGSLGYRNYNYRRELAEKSSLKPEKISDLALDSILAENIATLFNPKISSNLNFYEQMAETADEDIKFLYSALASLYDENNTRDAFTDVEKYEENFEDNTFYTIVRVGFLKAEDGDYHFENLSKDGYFRVESFSDYQSAVEYFNKNSEKFSAFKFNFRILDTGIYLKNIENVETEKD
ncbi:hypothetical protein IJH66_00100 [Candidatus Saccharibacteria bacterium]|nr:hypothetical protein [Candidatus Saccharibacteria bacterium]